MIVANEWKGCYDETWHGTLVPESFFHPAKISRSLVNRIYAHALLKGWCAIGDTVIDPFGGIGGTAFFAGMNGLNWIGVELEPRFVEIGNKNIEFWQSFMRGIDGCWKLPVLLNGNSCELSKVIKRANLLVSSPPYVSGGHHNDVFGAWNKNGGGQNGAKVTTKDEAGYGRTPGQLGLMKEGEPPTLLVSSPPYAAMATGAGGLNTKPAKKPGQQTGRKAAASQTTDQLYGDSEGQLAKADSETFWSSCAKIVRECHTVLRPGGHAIWVTKDFIRKGQRVPFGDQWQAVCEAAGFELVCRHRAMLVADYGSQADAFGKAKRLTVTRKSFYRRLAESKGSPAIDWEDVLCMVKA